MKRLLRSAAVCFVLFSAAELFAGDGVSASAPPSRTGGAPSSSESDALDALIASLLNELAGANEILRSALDALAEHQQSKPVYDGDAKQWKADMDAWAEQLAILEDLVDAYQNELNELQNELDALMNGAPTNHEKDLAPLFTVHDDIMLFSTADSKGDEVELRDSEILNALIAERLFELQNAQDELEWMQLIIAEHMAAKPTYDGNASDFKADMDAWAEQLAILEARLREKEQTLDNLSEELNELMEIANGGKQSGKSSRDAAASEDDDEDDDDLLSIDFEFKLR